MPPEVSNGATLIAPGRATGLQANLPSVPAPVQLAPLAVTTPPPPTSFGGAGAGLKSAGKTVLQFGGRTLVYGTLAYEGVVAIDKSYIAAEVADKQGKSFGLGFGKTFISEAARSGTTFLGAYAAGALTKAVIAVGVAALTTTPPGWIVAGVLAGVVIVGAGVGGYLAHSTGFSERVGNGVKSLLN